MARIAMTGGIASGKSAVADMLSEHGVIIIDSDVLAREVVEPGSEGLAAVVERFGEEILADDRSLDRPALGRVIFGDDRARADLNAILHPRIRRRAVELHEAAGDALVVQVIPLLVEVGLVDQFTHVIVVDVPLRLQLERLVDRDGYSNEEAESRISAQATRDERLAVADFVIDNSGSLGETRRQVDALVPQLESL